MLRCQQEQLNRDRDQQERFSERSSRFYKHFWCKIKTITKKEDEMQQLTVRTPTMGLVGPDWFHHHGTKMGYSGGNIERGFVHLSSSAASVTIFRGEQDVLVEW